LTSVFSVKEETQSALLSVVEMIRKEALRTMIRFEKVLQECGTVEYSCIEG
jgi:hypothetical protein